MFKAVTGWNCPGCGGLRMTHDLLHGDLSAAVVDNVFLLVGLPLLALWTLYRVRSGRRPFTPAVVAVIAGFGAGVDRCPQPSGFPVGSPQ